MSPEEARVRPRVEGDREQEILDATLAVLADVGYDRLTMDAVAAEARASKATLYRRYSTKSDLVLEALTSMKAPTVAPDTGSLRGDLISAFCGMGGLCDRQLVGILAAVITAIGRDADFAARFRAEFIGPKEQIAQQIYARAQERGEIRDDADLGVLIPALPGIVLHRQFLLGDAPDTDLIVRVIDQIILPAALKPSTDLTPGDTTS